MTIADTYANYSHDWWTPDPWMKWIKASLLVEWNKRHGLARDIFDPCPQRWNPLAWDALKNEWPFRPTYVNHPGSRGSTPRWWKRCLDQDRLSLPFVWCGFSAEQLRHMDPSPFTLDGFLVIPKTRIGFVWGGPDLVRCHCGKKVSVLELNRAPYVFELQDMYGEHRVLGGCTDCESVVTEERIYRKHGEQQKSPGDWTVFWMTCWPNPKPPLDCIVQRTGKGWVLNG